MSDKDKDTAQALRRRARKTFQKAEALASGEGPRNEQWRANALVQAAAGFARLAELADHAERDWR